VVNKEKLPLLEIDSVDSFTTDALRSAAKLSPLLDAPLRKLQHSRNRNNQPIIYQQSLDLQNWKQRLSFSLSHTFIDYLLLDSSFIDSLIH
jgi:hypothetical protein